MDKKKLEIETEFKTNLFKEFLSQHSLIIDKLYYSDGFKIRNREKPKEENYLEYLKHIDKLTISDLILDINIYDQIVPEDVQLNDSFNDSDKANQLNSLFFTKLLDTFRINLEPSKFLLFLDKKVKKDKYEKLSDIKFIINYLDSCDKSMFLNYVKRPKFLIQNYNEILDYIFENNIKNQEERLNIIDTLLNIDSLKDNNNQNLIYQLLNKYIDNPEVHYQRFSNISQEKNTDFFKVVNKTLKIEIDFISLNSYNVSHREYTHRNDIIRLVEGNLLSMNDFKSSLGFKDYTFDKSEANFSIYFTGDNLKENSIKACLNTLITKSLNEKKLYNAVNMKLTNADVIYSLLNEDLKVNKVANKINKI